MRVDTVDNLSDERLTGRANVSFRGVQQEETREITSSLLPIKVAIERS